VTGASVSDAEFTAMLARLKERGWSDEELTALALQHLGL
jgi:hypothetical protein